MLSEDDKLSPSSGSGVAARNAAPSFSPLFPLIVACLAMFRVAILWVRPCLPLGSTFGVFCVVTDFVAVVTGAGNRWITLGFRTVTRSSRARLDLLSLTL